MALTLVGSDIVHLDRQTFMWVQLTHFAIGLEQGDDALLASLIESPAYAHDYASPFPSEGVPVDVGIHGRWRLSEISTDMFSPTTAAQAQDDLQRWANEQEWTNPDYQQPAEVMRRLECVDALLRSGRVYKLRNPGPDAEHAYGAVTGTLGFHEFVAIERSMATVHLIVASDD